MCFIKKDLQITPKKSMAPAYVFTGVLQTTGAAIMYIGCQKIFPKYKKFSLAACSCMLGAQALLYTQTLAEYSHVILAQESFSIIYAEALVETIQKYLMYALISQIAYNHISAILTQPKNRYFSAQNIVSIKNILENLKSTYTKKDQIVRLKAEKATQTCTLLEQCIQGHSIECIDIIEAQDQCELLNEIFLLLNAIDTCKNKDIATKISAMHQLNEMIETWNQLAQALYLKIGRLDARFVSLIRFESFISTWTRLTVRPLKK
ncbi:MAG: hypothetical protein UU47_C0034G0002 [candidate division TM6 bacterium GW2011_GWE2_41_16]|nr:MAG: hypothetical protein UU47_C0034G0002 [candidate division TM6 bacterium GW2011_GWE2_41_16]